MSALREIFTKRIPIYDKEGKLVAYGDGVEGDLKTLKPMVKSSPFLKKRLRFIRTKAAGTCEQGERADLTGCIPASGEAQARPSGKNEIGTDKLSGPKTGQSPVLYQETEKKRSNYVAPPEGEKIVEPPGKVYDPSPHTDENGDGVADYSRVGVPAMSVPPPPPEIPRLPNLTEREREAESRFAEAFLRDPDGLAKEYMERLQAGQIGDAPNIFNTDDAKLLSPDYNPSGTEDEVKKARSELNVTVHQTANALAKRAFLKFLDTLPEDKKTVLVTSGGVASGKGFALANAPGASDVAGKVGAIWDAAGEQNATENPWVLLECKKRGIKPIFAFVHADPISTWENPQRGVVERAEKKGRMVASTLFAESYALGAKNFKAFSDRYANEAEFIYLDNTGKPQVTDKFPEDALKLSSAQIHSRASQVLKERASKLKPAVVRGGEIGDRIWGKIGEA